MTADGSYEASPESAEGRAATTYEPVAPPRRCPICDDPSDFHCGDLGCMGSWPVRECGCTLGAAQVERMSADA